MKRGDLSVLGVWNPSRKENDAYTGFAAHFNSIGLRVPVVFKYLPDEMVYLTEDLGDLDLYTWVHEKRISGDNTCEIEEMYKRVLEELVRFQFESDKELDYSLCYPRNRFDRSSVMWDLNYFKYMFLKLSGTGFNEQLLEEDFQVLAEIIEQAGHEGFLYRDFQSKNVMIKDNEPWFIDFQGGRKGAPHYDVASLLLDPYVELDEPMHDRLLNYYIGLLGSGTLKDKEKFLSDYRIFGIVRLLQALGAYGFRGLYERKPNFTDSIPPAVRQLSRIFEEKEIRKNLPELSGIVRSLCDKWARSGADPRKKTTIIVESFSFSKGIPGTIIAEGGFMFDCRPLSDPHVNVELRSLNGKDKRVIDFFEGKKDIQDMVENAYQLITGYLESPGIGDVNILRVCFGCFSGQQRSVYCAERISSMLRNHKAAEVLIFHNEIR